MADSVTYCENLAERLEGIINDGDLTRYLKDDVLEIEETPGGHELLLTYGGPTVTLNTATKTINYHWQGDQASRSIPDGMAAAFEAAIKTL